jgi:hypothetical protein
LGDSFLGVGTSPGHAPQLAADADAAGSAALQSPNASSSAQGDWPMGIDRLVEPPFRKTGGGVSRSSFCGGVVVVSVAVVVAAVAHGEPHGSSIFTFRASHVACAHARKLSASVSAARNY